MTVFAIYQALPASMVPSRDDDLIFNQIGWLFSINQTLSAIWMYVYLQDTETSFLIAQVLIGAQLALGLLMESSIMDTVTTTGLGLTEMISLRSWSSIYAGWLTAANLASLSILGEVTSVTNDDNRTVQSVVLLWLGFIFYAVNTYVQSDPLYGAILIWAGLGIRQNTDFGVTSAVVKSNLDVVIPLIAALDLYVFASNLGFA